MKKLLIAGIIAAGMPVLAGNPGTFSEATKNQPSLFSKPARENILKLRPSVFTKSAMGEEDREAHGPGLFINVGLFMPGEDYQDPFYAYGPERYKTGYTFEIGNYFRFFHTERFGVGLRASWIQLGYTTHQDTSWSHGNAWGSPVRLGPQFSYAINDVMGVDAFYQLGAQYHMDWYGGENMSFLGVSHEVGAAFRFTMFTAGFGYKFGKTVNIDNSDPNYPLDDVFTYSVNSFRVFLGIQL